MGRRGRSKGEGRVASDRDETFNALSDGNDAVLVLVEELHVMHEVRHVGAVGRRGCHTQLRRPWI
jgi:hypothetical protein